MNLPKSVILQFFIKNGAMIIVAVSLFLTMFIPALAILISLFALSFALVVFQTVRYGKNDIVFISHGDALEEAQAVADLVKEKFGIDQFLIHFVGPSIGAHSGPGTLALFFMGESK